MNEIVPMPAPIWKISTTDEAGAVLPSSGIRALMLAVLDDAIHSLSSPQRLVRAEAEHWMISPTRGHLFSFVVICEELDLEPRAVRRSVKDLLAKRQTPGRLLKRSRPNIRHRGPIQLATASHRLS